ncbi:MAG: DHHA1 domain-containing protein [Promethearchaeia archaeon]
MAEEADREAFLDDLDNTINRFMDLSFTKIVAISHNDADGISSLHLIQNLLYKMRVDYDYFIYNRSMSWSNYLDGILPRTSTEKKAFIFTDVGSNLNELVPLIRKRKEHFFILDHHEVSDSNLEEYEPPENLHFVNPTVYGFDGLDHMAGATLTYMFTKKIVPDVLRQGWLTLIGIAGDSLKPMDQLKSFNREIYQELLEEEIFEDREGLLLFGAMHQSIQKGLKYSILPFLEGFGGEDDKVIKEFLRNIGINPKKKVERLNHEEIEKIQKHGNFESEGHYAILPNKKGHLKFAFEHGLLLNILCFKNISAALSMVRQKTITRYAKRVYHEYISNLVQNLRTLINLDKYETEKGIFINAGKSRIPPSNWSDTASFTTVNEILDPYKILFLGGEEKRNAMIKLSIRCTRKFLAAHDGKGVNNLISKIKANYGGVGGGHKLAGGIRLSIASYKRLKQNVDDLINS